MVHLGFSSSNTTANTNMAQPSEEIGKNIAKPFPNLPQSKLNLQLFSLQTWQNWRPTSCSAAAELASTKAATPAAAKEWSLN